MVVQLLGYWTGQVATPLATFLRVAVTSRQVPGYASSVRDDGAWLEFLNRRDVGKRCRELMVLSNQRLEFQRHDDEASAYGAGRPFEHEVGWLP